MNFGYVDVVYSYFFGQTFIDSEVQALVMDLTGPDNEVVDYGVLPYNWMLA